MVDRLTPAMAYVTPIDRDSEYRSLLSRADQAGYHGVTVSDYHDILGSGDSAEPRRLLALRHDVDRENPRANEMFFAAERAVGMKATYYFRLSTAPVHRGFIGRLLQAGFEVGYHYEEAATVAKARPCSDVACVLERHAEIAELFISNCATFRREYNTALGSVSSHGDWVNRKLGLKNRDVIDDVALAAADIRFEAYDPILMDGAAEYISDVARWPARWTGDRSLGDALEAGVSPIYFLSHEYQWHSDMRANTRHVASRVAEGLSYTIRTLRR